MYCGPAGVSGLQTKQRARESFAHWPKLQFQFQFRPIGSILFGFGQYCELQLLLLPAAQCSRPASERASGPPTLWPPLEWSWRAALLPSSWASKHSRGRTKSWLEWQINQIESKSKQSARPTSEMFASRRLGPKRPFAGSASAFASASSASSASSSSIGLSFQCE